MKKRILLICSILVVIFIFAAYFFSTGERKPRYNINDFASCAAAGNPIMESYPEQCHHNGTTYTNPDQQPVSPPSAN